jgi:hypothetical protein
MSVPGAAVCLLLKQSVYDRYIVIVYSTNNFICLYYSNPHSLRTEDLENSWYIFTFLGGSVGTELF